MKIGWNFFLFKNIVCSFLRHFCVLFSQFLSTFSSLLRQFFFFIKIDDFLGQPNNSGSFQPQQISPDQFGRGKMDSLGGHPYEEVEVEQRMSQPQLEEVEETRYNEIKMSWKQKFLN